MNHSILIVDDSQTVRSLVRSTLEAKGVRVVEAADGKEGLWRARENQVDLVITDIHMPVMDGLRLIQELRLLPQYATTPIFVLTSDATGERLSDGKQAGADAWMLKPLNPESLWKVVERALWGKVRGRPEV